ncbi:unnamed protein product [Cuscuta campestris]|uniref:Uncharacterized protein n=1 Tax=Cuscuta campestris TaxID=132261 RepID=A0A484NKB9_9ASTE|nr:unnamed protein product [Cuscuta campestris]
MVQARQFVHFAFPRLKWTDQSNDTGIWKDQASNETEAIGKHSDHSGDFAVPSALDRSVNYSNQSDSHPDPESSPNCSNLDEHKSSEIEVVEASHSDKYFWKNIADIVNHNVVQRIGFPAFDKIRWDEFDLLNKIGLQSQQVAVASYIESGLATPEKQERLVPQIMNTIQSSLPDIKKATRDLLQQTDSILGALMVLNTTVFKSNKGVELIGSGNTKKDSTPEIKSDVHGYPIHNATILNETKAEEMRELFTRAETAMEAWAMLATSLGHPTFIKSEFDKICFLDNSSTDTQATLLLF